LAGNTTHLAAYEVTGNIPHLPSAVAAHKGQNVSIIYTPNVHPSLNLVELEL